MSLVAFTTFSPEASQASSSDCMWSDEFFSCDPTFVDGHCALDDGCKPIIVTGSGN
ncbi:hypothetical protein [Belliella aquatica]|nr:hypothetical protein [Belliella aquatica]